MNSSEPILVVDSQINAGTVLVQALAATGFEAHLVTTSQEALQACELPTFALVLLDLHLRGRVNGMELLTHLQHYAPQTVLVVLAEPSNVDAAILALHRGAVDYVLKPASVARIIESIEQGLGYRRQELKRRQIISHLEESLDELKSESNPNLLDRFCKTPTLMIDRQKRVVVHCGELLTLTTAEFDLLEFLVRHMDRGVTARELVQAIQGRDMAEAEARPLVRIHMDRLRQKLEPDPTHPRYILSLRGLGYRFADQI